MLKALLKVTPFKLLLSRAALDELELRGVLIDFLVLYVHGGEMAY